VCLVALPKHSDDGLEIELTAGDIVVSRYQAFKILLEQDKIDLL